MGFFIINLVVIAGLAVVVLRQRRDELVARSRRARWALYAALALMGLYALFFLVFAVGEMAAGGLSGAMHLVSALAVVVLMLLARRRPVEGGIGLVVLGVLSALYLAAAMRGEWDFRVQGILLGAAPFAVCGLLFLAAAALARRSQGGPA